MVSLSSYLGAGVYSDGKPIGRITDISVDMRQKRVSGLVCVGRSGWFRRTFFVPREGILHLDEHGAVAEKSRILYKKTDREEYGRFGLVGEMEYAAGRVGDFYLDPATLTVRAVSVKRGLVDDLLFGREIVDADEILLSGRGDVIADQKREVAKE